MKANLATSLIAYARGGVRKQLLVLCLLTLCAGNMWGGTRRIYFDYSDVTMWDDAGARMHVHCWGGNVSGADYDMLAVEGQTALVYADINEGHTSLCFYRQDPNSNTWWNQTQDWGEIGANNRFKIRNAQGNYGSDNGKYLWAESNAAIRWTPNVAIDGLLDPLNPHNQAFDNNGEYTVTLAARTTYEFKILNGSALYGLENHVWTSSVSKYTLYKDQYQIRLCTAGEGEYIFTWDDTNKQLSVTYPSVSHPSIDYCYVIDYKWTPSANLHVWNCTSELVGVWNGGSTIAGSTWPGAAISNKTTIGGQSYFYIAPGEYANFLVSKSGHETDRSGDLTTSDGYGKRRYWKDETDGWIWDTFTVRIQLENDGADAGHKGTENQDVAFNSDVLSDITCPEKTHYDFQGYYTEVGGTGTQVIDKHGHWIASVSDAAGVPYTDASKHWIHPGTSTTLYAKWTEHEYAITIAVEGSGTTSPASSTIGKIETPSGDITAAPGTGYSFSQWGFSKQGESDYDVWCAAGYTSTNATIRISAKRDGTLTAKFTANNYNVNLENLDADEKGTENVSVTYNSSVNLTENITIPEKAHYDFGGYYTSSDEGVTLDVPLIDENGAWIASVDDYTDSDKNWLYANNLTLYAKWTEHLYTVDLKVSPEGAGTIKIGEDVVGSVNAFISTQTDLITATPANPAWKFKEWKYSENVGPANDTGKDNTVQITAAQNGTLEAVFEPRFCLVGSIWDDSDNGGMPGWHDYDHTADFNINSYTDLSTMNLTCVRFLDPNTTYKFEVHDKVKGQNLGYAEANTFIADQSLLFNTQNKDVLLRVNGHGECTFTISALSSGDLYPTVSVAIPASHQLNLEWADVDIDNNWNKTSRGTGGSVSAQTTESGRRFDIDNDEYVAHGGDITYTATPATGYTFDGWYKNDYNTRFSTTNPYTSSNIQTTENVEAKFVEKATAVTLSNDGHGHVEINDETVSSTTVGITTHRELTAVPDEGYKFESWTKISGDDITLSSTSENPTTLFGLGAGAVSGQEVRANFDYRWTLKAESDGWGQAEFIIKNISTNASGDVVGYVDISLSANTNYQFTMYDKQESQTYKNGSDQVYYMTNGNSHNWSFATDKTYNCGITTAGAGTYRFIWNITDKKMTVTYPNFVIYRTGDKAGDERATEDDVESYDGGTISQAIEFRMRVNRLDYWYTLCLPFTVTAVKVWDEEDGQYYDIVPYWRTEGKYYTGHYILRKPVTTTNFAIEGFEDKDRWIDPESSDVLPSKNIPYIIQWHDTYFQDMYISFFGRADQIIPTAMDNGSYASSDETVNIYGNNSMTTGTVRDAYLLDPSYGTDGAWMREEIGTDRSVLPFECFILANEKTTAKYRVLRRDMADNTPTGLDTLFKTEDTASKVLINNRIYIIRGGKMYTIQGTFVKEVE